MRVLAVKQMGALRPADDEAKEEFAKLKDGQSLYVEIRRARNPRQHRLYWALIDLLKQYTEAYPTREDLSDAIKVAVGHCETMPLKNGVVMARPKSISFANLPQAEFEQFLDKVITFASTKIGTTNDELRQEIEAMVGPQRSAA